MKYYVCIQNCFEDYYSEDCHSLCFESKEAAIAFVDGLKGNIQYPFDVNGEIQSYFSDDEYQDFYQLIDVVPDEEYVENCDCYVHIPESIYRVNRHYSMDAKGNIEWCDWVKLVTEEQ